MKALIAAAWYWTRMLPATKSIPKELLPVVNKPVIHYIVEGLSKSGVSDIIFVTSQGKQAIEDYFDTNFELENLLLEKWKNQILDETNKSKNFANYCFVKQKEKLGFAHAVLSWESWIDDKYFLLTVWDEIYHPNIYKDILEEHKRTWAAVIGLKEVEAQNIHKYWIVKIENNIITDMIEKPSLNEAPSNLRMIGVYILPKKIMKIIKNTSLDEDKWEILLPDCLKKLMNEEKIYPYIAKDKVRDVWNPESWLKANNEIYQEKFYK